MGQFKDYYEILGVKPDDSQQAIKVSHRDKVIIFHPDRFMNAPESARRLAEEELKKVNDAFDILKDPIKKQKYDEEYCKSKGLDQTSKDTVIEPPKPVVDKSYILFDNVMPGDIKTDYFILSNIGGDYRNVDISVQSPNSWLKITSLNSLDPTQTDELPLRVEIEAKADEWGSNYIEYIIVRLDDEEIKVIIALDTIFESSENKIIAGNNVLEWKYAKLMLWVGSIGAALGLIITIIASFNISKWSTNIGWSIALIIIFSLFVLFLGSSIIMNPSRFVSSNGQVGAVFVMIVGGLILLGGIIFVIIGWIIFNILGAALEKK